MAPIDWKILLQSEHIPFEENTDLKKKTWIHRGGRARYYIVPDTLDQLHLLVTELYKANQAFKIVGHTSNLYIRNTTDLEIVISTLHLNRYQEENGHYTCECGVAIADLARRAIQAGHSGYEGLVNLPGTVASAAVNNAGCFQCCISDLLIDATILCRDGKVRTYTKQQFEYSERNSAFKQGKIDGVILYATLDCSHQESPEQLIKKADEATLYRRTRQEGPKQNLGSTFPVYVMKAFYSHLPLLTRFCLIACSALYHIIGKQRPQSVTNTVILLCNGKYRQLHRYVSQHNFGCFVWRDENADEAFRIYRSFVAKISGMPDIEIEVL